VYSVGKRSSNSCLHFPSPSCTAPATKQFWPLLAIEQIICMFNSSLLATETNSRVKLNYRHEKVGSNHVAWPCWKRILPVVVILLHLLFTCRENEYLFKRMLAYQRTVERLHPKYIRCPCMMNNRRKCWSNSARGRWSDGWVSCPGNTLFSRDSENLHTDCLELSGTLLLLAQNLDSCLAICMFRSTDLPCNNTVIKSSSSVAGVTGTTLSSSGLFLTWLL